MAVYGYLLLRVELHEFLDYKYALAAMAPVVKLFFEFIEGNLYPLSVFILLVPHAYHIGIHLAQVMKEGYYGNFFL